MKKVKYASALLFFVFFLVVKLSASISPAAKPTEAEAHAFHQSNQLGLNDAAVDHLLNTSKKAETGPAPWGLLIAAFFTVLGVFVMKASTPRQIKGVTPLVMGFRPASAD